MPEFRLDIFFYAETDFASVNVNVPQITVPFGHTCEKLTLLQRRKTEENFFVKSILVVGIRKVLIVLNRHVAVYNVLQCVVVSEQTNKVLKIGVALGGHKRKIASVSAYLRICNIYNHFVQRKICVEDRSTIPFGTSAADFVILHIYVFHSTCAGMNKKRTAVCFKFGMYKSKIFQHAVSVHNGDESVTVVRCFGKSADNVTSAVYDTAKSLTAVAVEIRFGTIDKLRHTAVDGNIVSEHKVTAKQLVVILARRLGKRADTHIVLFVFDYKRV